jgi:hypothetical protein
MRAVIWSSISLILLVGLALLDGLNDIGLICIPIAVIGLIYGIVGFAKDEKPGAAFCGLMTSGIVLFLFTWRLLIATA